MSFGFSVGDFVAVGGLIVKCIDALRNTQFEYQELIRELESLKGALSQVDKLKGRGDQAIAIDQIKCAALTCKYPLEQFLAKIQKYEKSLGLGKSVDKVRDAARKIQFALGRKAADRLRNYLNVHIGIINMLMLQNGLERLDVASEQSERNQEEIKDGFERCLRELKEVKGNTEAQVLAVKENMSTIQKLFWMVSGEIAAPLKALSQTVAKVCVSTQQIYAVVLELKNNAIRIETRFTWFQAPVNVEDALGRVFQFSSQCSIEALDAEIRSRFKKGPGRMEVMAGDFELLNAKNANHVLTIFDGNGLLPGMSITMAIVLEKDEEGFAEDEKCPMPYCSSKTFVEAVGGGRICSDCGLWFDKASKKRKRASEGEMGFIGDDSMAERYESQARGGKIDEETTDVERSDAEATSWSAFKRIRYTSREVTREKLKKVHEASTNVPAPLENTRIPNFEADARQREGAAALLEAEGAEIAAAKAKAEADDAAKVAVEACKKQVQDDKDARLEAEFAKFKRQKQEGDERYAAEKKVDEEEATRKEAKAFEMAPSLFVFTQSMQFAWRQFRKNHGSQLGRGVKNLGRGEHRLSIRGYRG